jgi:hypothetical protein
MSAQDKEVAIGFLPSNAMDRFTNLIRRITQKVAAMLHIFISILN